ncbi:hypothetical protein EAE91_12450 [Photorhabdus noenieputensis]|nr:hypothetical protein [Photorhabdus noenieputensis]
MNFIIRVLFLSVIGNKSERGGAIFA